ncbi:50S ribosomal protein L20 [Candidatus Vidania fulgoroideorum]
MSRVKSNYNKKKKRKKIFFLTKKFKGRRKNVYKIAKQANLKSMIYSYRDRKKNKSLKRKYWINEINNNMKINYSFFINKLKEKKISINRKMYFYLIKSENKCFKSILKYLGC